MFASFIRLILIYFFIILTIKLMGKRQIGELQMSELVTAFLLSELAVFAVTDYDIPLLHALLPIITVITLEVIISYLGVKIPILKKIFDNSPSILIARGKINQSELLKNRITTEELLSQLRLMGTADPDEVSYALLEPSGQISVIPKSRYRPPNTSEMNISANENGISHILITDGIINENALNFIGLNKNWLMKRLIENKICSPDEVFLFTANDMLEYKIIKKDKK